MIHKETVGNMQRVTRTDLWKDCSFKNFERPLYLELSKVPLEMTEYVDDELPLPPFAEIFGEGSMSNKKKSKKFVGARGDPNGDETTGYLF